MFRSIRAKHFLINDQGVVKLSGLRSVVSLIQGGSRKKVILVTSVAYECRKAAQRSVKLQYILQTLCCRITSVQTALYGKPL